MSLLFIVVTHHPVITKYLFANHSKQYGVSNRIIR